MIYFSDFFCIGKDALEEYGAFDISLINDLPLFIDPFLLYGSSKPEYKRLHEDILRYLEFLRDKSSRGSITPTEIDSWYVFKEIKQNWLGFSVSGNAGAGLGRKFGEAMSQYMHTIFDDLFHEQISESSHLEKATLFQIGVGKDNISDFSCNLIKSYLLEYTEAFALQHLQPNQVKSFMVERAYFDYDIERWMAKRYKLPYFKHDYIVLTPRDILTKDENWINGQDLRGDFVGICNSIPNDVYRREIDVFYKQQLPAPTYTGKGRKRRQKPPTKKEVAEAVSKTLFKYPDILDYFIKVKEENKSRAKSVSEEKVEEVEEVFQQNVIALVSLLLETGFYKEDSTDSYQEALKRIEFLKDVIENKDGYRLFYYKDQPIKRESDLQVIYRLTWYSSPFDVNREVNNGRGPADYIVSKGAKDKTVIEFKLASNTKLKMNLENQTKVYEKASDASRSIKAIMYFDTSELFRVEGILKELELENDDSIILIDAQRKPSASNVK